MIRRELRRLLPYNVNVTVDRAQMIASWWLYVAQIKTRGSKWN